MRDPMTVELARVLELTGEGSKLLGEFGTNWWIGEHDPAETSLLPPRPDAALSAVEFISLAASIIVALVAA
jgi:methyl-accepting chemotaxis protein